MCSTSRSTSGTSPSGSRATWSTTSSPSTPPGARRTRACAATSGSSSPRSSTARSRSVSTRSAPATTRGSSTVVLHRAVDAGKDQSYVLAVLRPEQIAAAMFPLGDSLKSEVRGGGGGARPGGRRQAGQPRHLLHPVRRHRRLAARPARRSARTWSSTRPGAVLGAHDGDVRLHRRPAAWARASTPAADGRPRYVLSVSPVSRTVTVGPAERLAVSRIVCGAPTWCGDAAGAAAVGSALAQVRAHGEAIDCRVELVDGGAGRRRRRRPARRRARPDPGGLRRVTRCSARRRSTARGVTRYASCCAAVNVGGNNKVPMARLRELAAELGYTDVATYVQSGNLVVSRRDQEAGATSRRRVAEALRRDLGVDVAVMVRSRKELAAVIAANPFGDIADDPKRLLVNFLAAHPRREPVARAGPRPSSRPSASSSATAASTSGSPTGSGRSKMATAPWERRSGSAAPAATGAPSRRCSTCSTLGERAGLSIRVIERTSTTGLAGGVGGRH